ncbi:MAG: OB-fold nucleic acid binding domain-containing protein [Actinomycetota bacterium]|nr:OB-fold nucleic acid binding domain-containing protein [Actinomycetota bacterium]
MGLLARMGRRLFRSDEDILADEVRGWAEDVARTTRIADCRGRSRERVAGVVKRIRLNPREGAGTLEVVVGDGTGEVVAIWTGRLEIPGLTLGTRLVLEGVLGEERGGLRMVNPRFEFG